MVVRHRSQESGFPELLFWKLSCGSSKPLHLKSLGTFQQASAYLMLLVRKVYETHGYLSNCSRLLGRLKIVVSNRKTLILQESAESLGMALTLSRYS